MDETSPTYQTLINTVKTVGSEIIKTVSDYPEFSPDIIALGGAALLTGDFANRDSILENLVYEYIAKRRAKNENSEPPAIPELKI